MDPILNTFNIEHIDEAQIIFDSVPRCIIYAARKPERDDGKNPGYTVVYRLSLPGTTSDIQNEYLSQPPVPTPVSSDKIEKLAVVVADRDSGDECVICAETIVIGDNLHRLECKHEFHVKCIRRWFVTRNKCPLCRAEI